MGKRSNGPAVHSGGRGPPITWTGAGSCPAARFLSHSSKCFSAACCRTAGAATKSSTASRVTTTCTGAENRGSPGGASGTGHATWMTSRPPSPPHAVNAPAGTRRRATSVKPVSRGSIGCNAISPLRPLDAPGFLDAPGRRPDLVVAAVRFLASAALAIARADEASDARSRSDRGRQGSRGRSPLVHTARRAGVAKQLVCAPLLPRRGQITLRSPVTARGPGCSSLPTTAERRFGNGGMGRRRGALRTAKTRGHRSAGDGPERAWASGAALRRVASAAREGLAEASVIGNAAVR